MALDDPKCCKRDLKVTLVLGCLAAAIAGDYQSGGHNSIDARNIRACASALKYFDLLRQTHERFLSHCRACVRSEISSRCLFCAHVVEVVRGRFVSVLWIFNGRLTVLDLVPSGAPHMCDWIDYLTEPECTNAALALEYSTLLACRSGGVHVGSLSRCFSSFLPSPVKLCDVDQVKVFKE